MRNMRKSRQIKMKQRNIVQLISLKVTIDNNEIKPNYNGTEFGNSSSLLVLIIFHTKFW